MQVRTPPLEPFLEMDDIQGMAVPGFLKPYHTLLGLRAGTGDAAARNSSDSSAT